MKKVLIIAYYWPPAGGPGVQRWLKFAKYLPENGFHPVVYVPENPSYPIIDEGLCADVPDNITIIKRKIWEPYQIASVFSGKKIRKFSSGIIAEKKKQSLTEKLFLWIRGNLFIPDARVFWVQPSTAFLQRYISENKIDVVITTGPPHSLHLIGMNLKNRLSIPWVADFRDPWTTIGYQKSLRLSAYAKRQHQKLERQVLNSADQIIVTSKRTKTEFAELTTRPIEVITNGYDTFSALRSKPDEKFVLAHIGSLLSGRNPKILWECLSEMVTELPGFSSDFKLRLVGATSSSVLDSINENGLQSFTEVFGYVPHPEAVRLQQSARVLLLIEIDSEETKSILPGKLFEYMVSERPIIAIGPDGSDIAGILSETNSGKFFTYQQKHEVKAQLIGLYEDFRNGTLQSHAVGLQRYSRKSLTRDLAHLLTKIDSPK
ncbi:MAG: glycosyl transferase family 1 [Flavobacterium sp.]|nr:MAG: glycosyl transferase family 1 [Flavobacterium sp.]